MPDHDPFDAHHGGFAADLPRLLAGRPDRRRALAWLAGAGALALSAGPAMAATTGCTVMPDETAGPFPGDGSNRRAGTVANALLLSGIVRRDIRSSLAGATGTADGVALTLRLRLVDTRSGCASLAGHAIYLWQCDRLGRYSMYSGEIAGENYLRGVQATDADGQASFVTVFPGCYPGRMPHLHFEVFRSAAAATSFSSRIKTSQIAFPTEACRALYDRAGGYEASRAALGRMSFDTDGVFRDGVEDQLATLTGSVAEGYVATLSVGIEA